MYKGPKTGAEYKNVHLLMKSEGGYLPGWYFSDECEQLNGHYRTLEKPYQG